LSLTDEFEALGVQFISIFESIDTLTDSGRMFKNILTSISELEREMMRNRVYSGTIAKVESGSWPGGKAPMGYKLIDGKIKINEDQANVVRSIFQMYTHKKKQLSMTKIMDHLNDHGITTSKGYMWTSRGILNILKNPIYKGKAKWGNFEIVVPSLVPMRQWNKAQQLREQKRTAGNISMEPKI
jgi:site-specific DNA recombinase